jgi:DNA-binding winged helix-turn-helix (wHTH) protein/tetratricopeptide (TPR) repeat protein
MSKETNELYEFGAFRVNIDQHTLERIDGVKNGSLPEKAFQTLVVLLRNGGNLVTKEQLIQSVWPDTIVEENNLDKCIWAVRHFLREKPGDQKYIETVRKHGYRFVADVRRVPGNVTGAEIETPIRSDRADGSPQPREIAGPLLPAPANGRMRKYPLAIRIAIVALVAATLLAILYFRGRRSASESTSVALLRGTTNENAYQYYLDSLNLMGRVSIPVAQEAVDSLEEAIHLDPGFARAYAGLARARVELSNLVDDPKPDCEKARIAVGQALTLDPSLAEAYQASGMFKHRCEWDFASAEADLRRALVLDPHLDSSHWAYAYFLNNMGRSDEAIAEIEQAISLNPTSVANHVHHGIILYCARRYDDAIATLRYADQIGHLNSAHGWLYTAYLQKGDDAQAFEWFIKAETEKQVKPDPARIEQLRSIFETAGWRGIRELQLETELASPVYVKGRFYRLARLAVQLGKTDDAFRYLNMAFERRDVQVLLLKLEPSFDPIKSDPRYSEILKRVGLPPDK